MVWTTASSVRRTHGEVTFPVPRFAPQPPNRTTTGAVQAMAMYAGQSVGAVREVQDAGEIVTELMDGAKRLLRTWTRRDTEGGKSCR